MSYRVKPKQDWILIKAELMPDKTEGGIIIPDKSKGRPHKAVVLAIGPTVKDVGVGESIVFGKYAGTIIHLENEQFMVIREDDIIASYELTD